MAEVSTADLFRRVNPRWFDIDTEIIRRGRPTGDFAERIAYDESQAQFNIVASGRRAYKTETAKRRLVRRLLRNSDVNYFIGGPVYAQVKRIFWADLKKMIPKRCMLGRPNESELAIYLKNGSMVQLLGLDSPDRIEGSSWHGGLLTEFASLKPGLFDANVLPVILDHDGWLDIEGVPEGQDHYYDLFTKAREIEQAAAAPGVVPQWRAHHWPSERAVSEDKLQIARDTSDPLTYQQEWEGKFVSKSGRVYYAADELTFAGARRFEPRNHILHVGQDFNIQVGALTVGQFFPDELVPKALGGRSLHAVKEFGKLQDTAVAAMRLAEFIDEHERLHEIAYEVHYYPDSSGENRNPAARRTNVQIMRKALPGLIVHVGTVNPPVEASISVTNSALCSVSGVRRFYVNRDECPLLAADLLRMKRDKKGEPDPEKDDNHPMGRRGHHGDTVRYMTWSLFRPRSIDPDYAAD